MMRRARKETQKQERRQAMLKAAWALFQTQHYDDVNMVDVAHEVGVAKGTLYLYFKTKEELFLAVLHVQFEQWFEVIDGRLTAASTALTVEQIAELLADSLASRPALTRLFALIHLVLEHNSNYDEIVAFKRMLQTHVMATGSLIEQKLPFLSAGEGSRFLLQVYAILLGIQQLANPSPTAAAVLEREPDMEIFRLEFKPAFTETVITFLKGLQAR